MAFADDLVAFSEETEEELNKGSNALHREALLAAGLTRVLSGDTMDTLGSIYYGTTQVGGLLHSLFGMPD